MKVTGNKIREALRRAVFRRQILDQQFATTLYAFEGEQKATPQNTAEDFQKADSDVAMLQAIQQYFNQNTAVKTSDGKMPLALAIKLIGGAGRVEKMWREAAGGGKKDRYAYGDNKTRNKDEIRAELQVTPEEALKKADKAARRASSLREAIADGNAKELKISNDDVSFDIPIDLLD